MSADEQRLGVRPVRGETSATHGARGTAPVLLIGMTGMTFDPQRGRRGGVQEREAPAPGTCVNVAALTGVRTDVEVKAQIKTGLCLQ